MQDANFVKILSRVNELLPLIQLGKMKVFRGKLESACLSIHVSVCQSVCVQNTSVCQSAGGGIKSHLVTALGFFFFLNICNSYVVLLVQ